ncbi:hypothetical protein BGZ46_005475 [Entomortierella lignicola]|nr:hypothetical protein BGZ46_005475 [Entomortierella lignicola]
MFRPQTINHTIPNVGIIQGTVDNARHIAIFRNIPFAKVPERWRPAVKSEPWAGVRYCTRQGPICPHVAPPMDLFAVPGKPSRAVKPTEDDKNCLNLNIWVPLDSLKEGAKPIPVVTWVHGGGNSFGSNAAHLNDASNLVYRSIQLDQPVIVVSINYRLSVFGFLASKELQEEMEEYVAANPQTSAYDQSIGNWGLMDQKLAFEWIRENISAFGGNSRNVTAIGESAGAVDIHYHMIIPSHHGLFDHAIMQSGTVYAVLPGHIHEEGQTVFDALLKELGIPLDIDGKEKLKRLRETPAEKLKVAGENANQRWNGDNGPFYDGGKFLPPNISIEALSKDISSYDPNLKSVLIGTNKDEGTLFTMIHGQRNLRTWPSLSRKFNPYPELDLQFRAAYGAPKTDAEVTQIVSNILGDMFFVYGTRVLVDTLVKLTESRGKDAFKVTRYSFEVVLEDVATFMPDLGSFHVAELPLVFNSPSVQEVLSVKDLAFAKEMQTIWIGFANQKELAVNTPDGTSQRPALAENDEAIVFQRDHKITIGKGQPFSNAVRAYWEAVDKLKEKAIKF